MLEIEIEIEGEEFYDPKAWERTRRVRNCCCWGRKIPSGGLVSFVNKAAPSEQGAKGGGGISSGSYFFVCILLVTLVVTLVVNS